MPVLIDSIGGAFFFAWPMAAELDARSHLTVVPSAIRFAGMMRP